MMNLVFAFLILPLAPFWFYEDIVLDMTERNQSATYASDSCYEDACDDATEAYKDEYQINSFEKYNIFPVNSVSAAGLIPTRKEDVSDLKIWARSSVVIDVDTGTIIHYDNGRKRTQIASLTKMMTAILVMENVKDLNEEVTLNRESLNIVGTVVGCPTSVFCNGNRMFVGEKVTVESLLKAALMNSANDAATALATYVGGTPKGFVEMMNERAKSMGLKDTQFCTPSGLEIDGKEDQCYSTAYDIARIAAFSLKYEKIWEIMRMSEGRFYSTDGKYMHELKNTVMLINNLPNCLGGKTGFTPLAGKSLMLGAEDPTNKHKIIAVILDDNQRWDDMKTLVNWTFENYTWQ